MTTRGPPSRPMIEDGDDGENFKKDRSKKEIKDKEMVVEEAKDSYKKLIQSQEPLGYWPLDETVGMDCYDAAVMADDTDLSLDLYSQV